MTTALACGIFFWCTATARSSLMSSERYNFCGAQSWSRSARKSGRPDVQLGSESLLRVVKHRQRGQCVACPRARKVLPVQRIQDGRRRDQNGSLPVWLGDVVPDAHCPLLGAAWFLGVFSRVHWSVLLTGCGLVGFTASVIRAEHSAAACSSLTGAAFPRAPPSG